MMVFPTIAKTGKVARLEVTTRESKSLPGAVNVRIALAPNRRIRVEAPGGAIEADGAPLMQFPVVMN